MFAVNVARDECIRCVLRAAVTSCRQHPSCCVFDSTYWYVTAIWQFLSYGSENTNGYSTVVLRIYRVKVRGSFMSRCNRNKTRIGVIAASLYWKLGLPKSIWSTSGLGSGAVVVTLDWQGITSYYRSIVTSRLGGTVVELFTVKVSWTVMEMEMEHGFTSQSTKVGRFGDVLPNESVVSVMKKTKVNKTN